MNYKTRHLTAHDVTSVDTRTKSQLDVLTAIERGEVTTQMTLRKRIGVSVGMVNALLKRAAVKGYVKVRQAPYKRYAYYLTPRGFAEKSRLVAAYLESSLSFFRNARDQYRELFERAKATGARRFALAGSGELAEIATLAAISEDVTLVAILDPESNQDRRHGVAVARSLSEIGPVDAIVITDQRDAQATYEGLREALPQSTILAPEFLRITPDRAALIAAAGKAETGT